MYVFMQGHSWTGEVQDHHNRLLQRSYGKLHPAALQMKYNLVYFLKLRCFSSQYLISLLKPHPAVVIDGNTLHALKSEVFKVNYGGVVVDLSSSLTACLFLFESRSRLVTFKFKEAHILQLSDKGDESLTNINSFQTCESIFN